MSYLSPQIEAYAKKKKLEDASLIKKTISCGIFQDYGDLDKNPAPNGINSRSSD